MTDSFDNRELSLGVALAFNAHVPLPCHGSAPGGVYQRLAMNLSLKTTTKAAGYVLKAISHARHPCPIASVSGSVGIRRCRVHPGRTFPNWASRFAAPDLWV